MTLTCKSKVAARDCVSCKLHSLNQLGKPAGHPVTPKVTADKKCSHYVGVPGKAVKR
jgi:hypothetical protein